MTQEAQLLKHKKTISVSLIQNSTIKKKREGNLITKMKYDI